MNIKPTFISPKIAFRGGKEEKPANPKLSIPESPVSSSPSNSRSMPPSPSKAPSPFSKSYGFQFQQFLPPLELSSPAETEVRNFLASKKSITSADVQEFFKTKKSSEHAEAFLTGLKQSGSFDIHAGLPQTYQTMADVFKGRQEFLDLLRKNIAKDIETLELNKSMANPEYLKTLQETAAKIIK